METTDRFIETVEGFIDSGRYHDAIARLNNAIEAGNAYSKVYELRGLVQYLLLNTTDALEDLTKAFTLDNQNHLAISGRGHIYLDKQDYPSAERDFRIAMQIIPENTSYILNLAMACLQLRKNEECIILTNKVLEEEPVNYFGLYYKALALSDQRNHSEAIKCYKKLLQNYTHSAELYNGIGFSQIYTHELKKAKNNFALAIENQPGFAYPWDNLGYVFYLEKNYTEALKLINHSIALDPSNSWAFKNRALVYLDIGEKGKAMEDLHSARDLGYASQYDNEVEYLLESHFKNK